MAIAEKSKIILAKVEATYGVDPTPAGADALLVLDFEPTVMEGDDLSRELELPALGAQPTIPVGLYTKIKFKVELAPSGSAGVAPAWGKLLRGCACAQTLVASTSVTYNPISSGFESLTFYFWYGETLYKMRGAYGTCLIRIEAQKVPYLEFEFTGKFIEPVEASRPTPNLAAWKDPQHASTLFTPVVTLGGTTFTTKDVVLDMGVKVEPRLWIGSESFLITDKAEQISMTVQAVPLTSFDPYAAALNSTDVPIVVTHGVGAGRIASLAIPKAQMQRMAGLSAEQNIIAWPLRLVPRPGTAFNDQWTLTLT